MPRTVRQSPAPEADPVSLAWRRSTLSGLTPRSARPGTPDPRANRSRRLAEAARPVMDGLDPILRDTGASLVLADREGRVIRTVRDNARTSRMLLRRGVDDGATLTEETIGNNGIGTALETRAGVFIHGDQHFAEMLRDFVCYGHPIIDPLTRRLVGAVNLTGMSADASRLFAPFVRKIVADIEARYVDTARADDRELWHRFVERRARLLDLTFPDPPEPTPPGPGAAPRGPVAPSGAPTPVGSHAIEGPSGSGRTTTARAFAGPDARHVRLAEADDGASAWRELAAPALREQGGSMILDDIDLLDDADLRRLAARLQSAGADLVVVTSRDDPRPAVTAVLDMCDRQTVVRPLHERGTEGREIVRSMVADLATRRGLRPPAVTARFVDAACGIDLPNGLISLRSILADCLSRVAEKGGGTLDVDALPSRARSTRPPRTGELARGEYDAIVAALSECDGVRSRAAARLGISRTTLYARMRQFGLS